MLACFAVLGPTLEVQARRGRAIDPLVSTQRRLQAIQQRKQEILHRVRVLKVREYQAVEELSGLQQRLEQTTIQLEDSRYRMSRARRALDASQNALRDASRRFRREQTMASQRLRTVHRRRHENIWEAMLTAPDLASFITRYQYLKYISRQDQVMLDNLRSRRSQISQEKRRHGQALQQITVLTNNIEDQKEEISSDTQDQSSLVTRIRSERAAAESALAQLERDSQQIEAMIRRLMAARRRTPRMGTGRFARPVAAAVGDTFGLRYHPILHVRRPHRGVDFRAGSGATIHSADRGTVIFSGWFGSFGKVVIVDHGGDLTTLYAHCSRIYVDRGQAVERGQAIAAVGSTGLSTGPHLHFEVRRDGAPVDPLNYLR
jgi:murein DD-endopeptidase MepM/ murein hydrolase activator NlpD